MTSLMSHDHPLKDIILDERLPFIFCIGCTIGGIISCVASAFKKLDFDMDNTVVASGIGCSGRASGYYDCGAFHATHGRSIAFAVGAKVANPDLNVVVVSGDGDIAAIGGNHLIHAARRNIGITVVEINNFNYGMTGGQAGPTTPYGDYPTTTTAYMNPEHPFNMVKLVAAAGATYVARWTALDLVRAEESIMKALQNPGFSFVEIISACPTYFFRATSTVGFKKRQEVSDAVQMLQDIQAITEIYNDLEIPPHEAEIDYLPSEEGGRIICGEFVNIRKPEYTQELDEVRKKAQKKKQR